MQGITIRKAVSDDIDVLLMFEQDLINTERPFDPTLKPAPVYYYKLPEMITSPHILLVVAEYDNAVIGCGYARIQTAEAFLQHTQYAYLGFMYTLPAWRGKGVNRVILDALKQWSLEQGMTELRLEVYHHNASAIRAYEKAGFVLHKTEMRMAETNNKGRKLW